MKTVPNLKSVLFAIAACAACPAAGADRLYYFLDAQGVAHFSNVPADPRYRPLPGPANPVAPQAGVPSVSDAPSSPEGITPDVQAVDTVEPLTNPDPSDSLPDDIAPVQVLTDDLPIPSHEPEDVDSEADPKPAER
jgi:hypothetical protein